MQDIVLKILSGPMFGVDVSLPDDNVHLFFCDSETIDKNQSGSVYQYAINTLLIPCAKGANEKILLRLNKLQNDEQSEQKADITAQLLPTESLDAETEKEREAENSKSADVITVPLNQPVSIGYAVIALKNSQEEWSKDVTQYNFPLPTNNVAVQAQNANDFSTQKKRPSVFQLAMGGLFCLACAAVIFMLFLPNKVGTVKDILTPVNPDISQAKNGHIYILASTEYEAAWSENALRKSNLFEDNIKILAQNVELTRMKTLLSQQVVPFFDVKFTSASTLILLLSKERSEGNVSINQTIQKLLTQEFPYITTINIKRISDNIVIANAAERLKSMGFFFRKEMTPNHTTFSISGEMDDFQLETLRRQINEFYDQYGDQYVKFVINLNEDPLRNRTFKTGIDSYVVVPGNHWLYSDVSTVR